MPRNSQFSTFHSPLSFGIAPPVYEFDRSGLMLTFHANPEHLKKALGGEKFGESSGKSSGKILRYLRENPRITIPELAEKLGLSTRGVEKQIARLKSDGVLQRIGPAKGGHWEVKSDNHE